MLQLSEIWVYPVKSLGGILVPSSKITDRGLQFDRRWLLVDEQGRFLSQREYPKLALFSPEFQSDSLKITYREDGESIHFLLNPKKASPQFDVTVWDDVISVFEVDASISTWFSRKLGFSVRLVYMPDASHRLLEPEYAISPNDLNSFSDGYPFLVIGQASLDDLNTRLQVPVAMNRFRPNFVFANGVAFEEDSWRNFTIGNVSFVGVKPCDRCIMTTVDQEKGVLSGKDPLKTLATYRNFGNKVLFGQNVIGLELGSVAVGDLISIKSKAT